ncbi:hypothetical protein Nocox_37140 [Nonomuraea coxensis DSM 45129]|uniref:GerMN domain-containing protein n=1 Tax=Nonomuraea coxensis DSM 45129 TaxID=1122611 RepID=A0ABX8UE98_9ACTN|nr:hypothetical protein [Nonomuraea coxensis]QYC44982.1 hypothetical protein Nocox_37140 [Nonomuraea coxensis DSM 45129]
MRARTSLALLACVLLAACGISPTDVQERGNAPTVSIPPPSKTIYLIRNGKLAREPADVGDDTVESLLGALFAASGQPLGDRDTALRGFTYLRTKDSLNPVQRDEMQLPRTLTLTVYIRGSASLSDLGKAQIVCTAQQDAAYEQVKIVRDNENRPPKDEGRYTCGDLRGATS